MEFWEMVAELSVARIGGDLVDHGGELTQAGEGKRVAALPSFQHLRHNIAGGLNFRRHLEKSNAGHTLNMTPASVFGWDSCSR